MSKLSSEDNTMDVIMKMSEGNPGATTCLVEILRKDDWTFGADSITMVLSLDTLELYGSKLYMLWNDCCKRDLKTLELVLRNYQMGLLSKEEIHRNLNRGRGTPFDNLKTIEELFK